MRRLVKVVKERREAIENSKGATLADALAQAKRLTAKKPKPRPLPPGFHAHLDCVGGESGKASSETIHRSKP